MRKIISLIVVFTCLEKSNLNGQYWSALGEGIPGGIYSVGVIYSSAVYNGELYVGGRFDTAGGVAIKNIAKWNGTNWSAVGSGIDSYNSYDAGVISLKVYNGELYAAGRFDTVGGVLVKNIAKWNGTNWSPVGMGIPGVEMDQGVYSLAVHNGMLYAGGRFDTAGNVRVNNIAQWDGVAWSPLGTGINGRISALMNYDGSLYAGGNFTIAGGNAARCIAKWDGVNWSALGTGINDYGVFCLGVYNNALYAGGWFTQAGGIAVRSLAKWNGINWSSIGNGVGEAVLSLFTNNDTLYVGGSLTPYSECIAKWNDTNWSSIGNGIGDYNGASVWSINEYNGHIYAGGSFQTAGDVQVNNIAKWTNQCSIAPLQPGNINGNITVCQNSQVTYSIGPVNDAADFTWTLPLGWSGSSVSNTITATVGTDGGSISVVANNPCGSSSHQTLIVTVTPPLSQPGNIIGKDTVCVNGTETYSIIAVPGATGYIWSFPPGWTGNSITNSITATAGESGTISVVAINDYCISVPQTLDVTVNYFNSPHPGSIIGNTSVCRGSTQTYSVQSIPGTTEYYWTLPAGWTGSSTSSSITVNTGDSSGTISLKISNNCDSAEVFLNVSVDSILAPPGEISGNKFAFAGQWERYSVNTINGNVNYIWSIPGGGSISSIQNQADVFWQLPGSYQLSLAAGNKCGPGAVRTLTVNVQAPDEKNPFDLQIFPNPNNGEFYITAKRIQNKMIRVEVLSMSGQRLLQVEKRPGANDYSQFISLDKMPQGLYIVNVIIDNQVFAKRIAITN